MCLRPNLSAAATAFVTITSTTAAWKLAQMSATYSFKANLQTLRTADQMLGTLLDVRA